MLLPIPAVPKPALAELFQLYVVLATGLEKAMAAEATLPQEVMLATALTVGVGLTVTVKLIGVPVQVPAVGITVTVAMMGAEVAFVAGKAAILPVPVNPKPTLTELVQLMLVPVMGVVKLMGAPVATLQ